MNCANVHDKLDDYLDRNLAENELGEFDIHTGSCAGCRELVQRERELRAALQKLPVEGPTSGFFDRALETAVNTGGMSHSGWRAAGIGSAIAASLALVFTAVLFVGFPDDRPGSIPGLTLAMHDVKTVNLMFSSAEELTDAVLVVRVPPGVEIQGYAGRQEVRWTTNLREGKNVLPLDLVAQTSGSGELVARLEHANKQKTFRIQVTVM